ncbi:MAG: nucleoside-diphosphate kinase [Methanothrix sp.]|nr:MAG: nucleoside-diphosphate kinase [Methanothrix sp.]
MERTFFMIKPDGVQRGLVGKIIQRVEDKGLKIVAMKMRRLDQATAEEHYAEHREKPFFKDLVDFIISGPSVPMVVEGKDAISEIRRINGATNPTEALPGTIRGDFGLDTGRNVVHGSDSPASAEREITLHFEVLEMIGYSRIDEAWLYE